MKFRPLLLCALLASLTICSSASADTTRCPNTKKIINDGMNQAEVEAKCGTPSSRVDLTSTTQVTTRRHGRVETTTTSPKVEEWTYDFGPQQFMQKLRFEDGVLKSIQSGDRGSKRAG